MTPERSPEDSLKTWRGEGFALSAIAGGMICLFAGTEELVVDDEDVELLCEVLLRTAEDGIPDTFESCTMAHKARSTAPQDDSSRDSDTFLVTVNLAGEHGELLSIDAQYTPTVLVLPRASAHPLALALLAAKDHFTCGPCPHCGRSVADEHPVNGCP